MRQILEIINPSDAYTLVCEDIKVAQAACLLLGSGAYGLEDDKGNTVLPLLLFGGVDKWILENFGPDGAFSAFVDEHLAEIAECLESVMIFNSSERFTYDEALKVIQNEGEREQYRRSVHERNRTSLNNIGAKAWKIAKAFREKALGKEVKQS